jgi:hypothetical protein
MEHMLVVQSLDGHGRDNCTQVHSELEDLMNLVASESYELVAAPRPTVETSDPEAVQMPPDAHARDAAYVGASQVREHTGSLRTTGWPRPGDDSLLFLVDR